MLAGGKAGEGVAEERERRRMETKTEISLPAERCERSVGAKEGVRGDGGGS